MSRNRSHIEDTDLYRRITNLQTQRVDLRFLLALPELSDGERSRYVLSFLRWKLR